MNEIDAKVLAAAQDYNREWGKPPALVVVHPEIAKRMTTTRFLFPKLPELDMSAFLQVESPPPCGIDTINVEVKILDTSRMEPLEYVLSSDRIDCLNEYQVMEVLMRKF